MNKDICNYINFKEKKDLKISKNKNVTKGNEPTPSDSWFIKKLRLYTL